MAAPRVLYPPLIVTCRTETEDRPPVDVDPRRLCIVRADHVRSGDLVLASFERLEASYFNTPYEADPMPYDRGCSCGVCGLLASEPGPVVVLSIAPWGVCDPHPAAAPLLITPAAPHHDPAVPEPLERVICCASGLVAPDPGARLSAQRGGDLSERDRAIINLAARGFRSPGARDRAIREQLGLTPTRYFQLLNGLLNDVRALAHDPVTINRLRRIREENRVKREHPARP